MLPPAIRKLSCNPGLRRFAHHLHLSHLARRVYCRLLSSNGALQVSCLGVNAVFKTANSKQLSFVDYIATSESYTIEAALCDLKTGDTFLDVVCHYGIFSLLAAKLVGPAGLVIAVEPHPEPLQVLRTNLAVNRCENVRILDFAFSDTTGPLELAFNEYTASAQQASDLPSTVQTVRSMAGDEALRNTPVPASVKIDVEGHEFAVLRGLKQTLSNPACRRLCLEIHPPLLPPGVSEDGIMTFIRECGFSVVSDNKRSAEFLVIAAKQSGPVV